MTAVCFATILALLALAASVSCETCPEAKAKATTGCAGRLGCFVPECEGDEFRARQCHGSGCYCVDTNGERIGDYWFGYGEYSSSECDCARDQASGENVACKSDGDYL